MDVDAHVVVVGGGPAGCAAAAALTTLGLDVAHSVRPDPDGAALTLWPNAQSALERAGLRCQLTTIGSTLGVVRMTASTGRVLFETEAGWLEHTFASPGVATRRPDLVGLLRDSAPAVNLWPQTHTVTKEGKLWACHTSDAVLRAPLVVAADGIHSRIRGTLLPRYRLRRHPMVVLRGLAEADLGLQAGEVSLGVGTQIGLFPTPTGTYWFVAVDGRRVDLSNPLDAALRAAAPYRAPIAAAITATPQRAVLVTHVEHGTPVSSPPAPGVALVGDAAHPMPPTMGQGAGLAFEDVCVLAEAITHWGGPGPAAATAYHRQRRRRVRRASRAALAAATTGLWRGRAAALARNASMAATPQVITNHLLSRDFLFA